jgi:hypothetical protein
MHRLPVRLCEGKWEVLLSRNGAGHWLCCDSEKDARQMAASGNLAYEAIDGKRPGEDIAQDLEACARTFSNYGCDDQAKWLMEHAKIARGEPSVFDVAPPSDG